MNFEWIIFVVVLVLMPVSILSFKRYAIKKVLKYKEFTKEQKKNINFTATKGIAFCWLLDLFYMSFIINNLKFRLVIGFIIIVLLFANISSSIINSNKKDFYYKITTLIDFIFGIILSAYLIYIIEDSKLQEIVLGFVTSLFGGLIALIGVAWTIKKSDNDKKNEEINKAKPIFSFYNVDLDFNIEKAKYKIISKTKKSELNYSSCLFVLENSNESLIKINRVYHDGNEENFEGNSTILPGRECAININFKLSIIFICILDKFNNEYFYRLNLKRKNKEFADENNKKYFEYDVFDIVECTKEMVNLLNIKDNGIINEEKKDNQGD